MKAADGKNPNPQGKGQSPTLGYLTSTVRLTLPPLEEDSSERLVEEYLASLLVLSSSFSFKPVPGGTYYLYYHKQELILSLISPGEGGQRIFDEYWAVCRLGGDCAWTVEYADEKIRRRVSHDSLEGIDPEERLTYLFDGVKRGDVGGYRSSLGYYQKVLNYALGKCVGLRSQRLLELKAPPMQAKRISVAERKVSDG